MEETLRKNVRKMPKHCTIASLVGNAILRGGIIEEITEVDSEGIAPLHFSVEIPDLEGNNRYMDVSINDGIIQIWQRYLEDTLSYTARYIYSDTTVYDFNDRIIYEEDC